MPPLPSFRWLLSNVEQLHYVLVPLLWNPSRMSSQRSEVVYEAAHAFFGLLGVWNKRLNESEDSTVRRPAAALYLDLLEQFEILIEIRAMHLERNGKMSRYGPLAVLETVKALLKVGMWTQYPGHLFLRHPGPEDLDQFESEQGLSDVVAAMERLRLRYTTCQQPPGLLNQLRGWFSLSSQLAAQQRPHLAQRVTRKRPGSLVAVSDIAHPGSMQDQWGSEGSPQSRRSLDTPAGPGGGTSGVTIQQGPGSLLTCAWTGNTSQQSRMGIDLVWVGELLHIWRPVVYVCLLKKYGRSSWRPWTISLAVDLLSMHFTHRGKAMLRQAADGMQHQHQHQQHATQATGPSPQQRHQQQQQQRGRLEADMAARIAAGWSGPVPAGGRAPGRTSLLSLAMARGLLRQPWSPGETQELSGRRWNLLWYLMRSPALEWGLRPLAEGLRHGTSRVPLVSNITDYVADLLEGYTVYYGYTSCSQ